MTSIGENTESICRWQLEKFGFEVVLLDGVENWVDKYNRFLNEAKEDCIRIDADVIPNKYIKMAQDKKITKDYYMVDFRTFDLYKNDIGATTPIYYKKEAIELIRGHDLNHNRPETHASRLRGINKRSKTIEVIVGVHGLCQREEDVKRHKENKITRGQIEDYDFELVDEIMKL